MKLVANYSRVANAKRDIDMQRIWYVGIIYRPNHRKSPRLVKK